MNRVFCVFLWDAPSAASLLAPSFPLIPECPLIHSKVVAPARFLILLMVGLIMLAWLMLAKFSLVCLLLFSLRAFMAHSESVFMWRLAWLGIVDTRICWLRNPMQAPPICKSRLKRKANHE